MSVDRESAIERPTRRQMQPARLFLGREQAIEPGEFKQLPSVVGFDAPPAFLVGYGLDHAENFRHLPFIGDLE